MIASAVFCWALMLYPAGHECLSAENPAEGSNSKHLRKQTVNSLPYHQLNQQTKDKISAILNKPSIYRRLPVTAINTDPDYFRFLVRYPEVVVNIWQLMGVTKMSTERTGPFSISTNDGAGTVSSLELVYGTDNLHIFYGTGSYEGPILKRKLSGQCVLVLRTENSADNTGKPTAVNQLDVFLKVDNATVGLIAKTIQPLVGPTADHNFVESLKFVQRLNETTAKNGPGVQRMGSRLDLDPNVRQQFNQVVDVVFQRAINASVPVEKQYPGQSVPMDKNYLDPNQIVPRQRNQPSSIGRQHRPGSQASPYQQPNEMGQYRAVLPGPDGIYYPYPRQPEQKYYNGPNDSRLQMVNGYSLPARGPRAPTYGLPTAGSQGYHPYPQQFSQPVQASFQYGRQPQNNVQPAGGWRQR